MFFSNKRLVICTNQSLFVSAELGCYKYADESATAPFRESEQVTPLLQTSQKFDSGTKKTMGEKLWKHATARIFREKKIHIHHQPSHVAYRKF